MIGKENTLRLIEISAVFTYSGRFLTRRKASDGAVSDEGMASAIAEENDGPDGAFVAGRKLVEYVNTTEISNEV